MNKLIGAVCAAVLVAPGLALAKDDMGCNDVNWGDEVLAQLPRVADACQQVKIKGEGIYARFAGEVVSTDTKAGTLTLHMKDRDNKDVSELVVKPPPGLTFESEGKTHKFSEAKRGDKLDIWIEHGKWGIYTDMNSPSLVVLSRKAL